MADVAADRSPRELLADIIDLQAKQPAAYMALQSADPSVLQEHSRRHDFAGRTEEIILALAGRDATSGCIIRASMAVAAAREGATAALRARSGVLAPDMRLAVLNAAMAVVESGGRQAHEVRTAVAPV